MMEALQMGGYAFYVWTSYGAFVLVLLIDVVASLIAKENAHRAVRARARRDATRKSA